MIIEPVAREDIGNLDSETAKRIVEKIEWLGDNASLLKHHSLTGLPKHLKGLCKRVEGDYRILYWIYHRDRVLKVYGVIHRSYDYKRLRN